MNVVDVPGRIPAASNDDLIVSDIVAVRRASGMASDRAARRREILDSSGTKYRLLSAALKLANTPRSSG